jgi:hypothetical protein
MVEDIKESNIEIPQHINIERNYYVELVYKNTSAIRTILVHENRKRTEYMFKSKEYPDAEAITSIDTSVKLREIFAPYCEIIKGFRCVNVSKKEITELEIPIDVHVNRTTDREIMFRIFSDKQDHLERELSCVKSFIKSECGQDPTHESAIYHKISKRKC